MIEMLNRAVLALSRAAEAVAIAALFAVTALIALQIGAREFLSLGIPWADEAARYAGLAVIFLGAPIILIRNEHVKIDMFVDMLPPRARGWLVLVNEILMAVFALMFLVAGWYFLERAARFSTPAIGMPNLVFYLPAAIGMMLLFLVSVSRVLTGIAAIARGDDRP